MSQKIEPPELLTRLAEFYAAYEPAGAEVRWGNDAHPTIPLRKPSTSLHRRVAEFACLLESWLAQFDTSHWEKFPTGYEWGPVQVDGSKVVNLAGASGKRLDNVAGASPKNKSVRTATRKSPDDVR